MVKVHQNHEKSKKSDFHVFSMGKSRFSLTSVRETQRGVITPGPICAKMVLNEAQGLKGKSQEVSARKNIDSRRYIKKFGRGGG